MELRGLVRSRISFLETGGVSEVRSMKSEGESEERSTREEGLGVGKCLERFLLMMGEEGGGIERWRGVFEGSKR